MSTKLADPHAPTWLQPGTAVETEDPTWIAHGHITWAELWDRVGTYLGDPPDHYHDIPRDQPPDDMEHLYAVTFMQHGDEWIRWMDRNGNSVPADYPGAFPVTVWEP